MRYAYAALLAAVLACSRPQPVASVEPAEDDHRICQCWSADDECHAACKASGIPETVRHDPPPGTPEAIADWEYDELEYPSHLKLTYPANCMSSDESPSFCAERNREEYREREAGFTVLAL